MSSLTETNNVDCENQQKVAVVRGEALVRDPYSCCASVVSVMVYRSKVVPSRTDEVSLTARMNDNQSSQELSNVFICISPWFVESTSTA